jgi:hypothetical protein
MTDERPEYLEDVDEGSIQKALDEERLGNPGLNGKRRPGGGAAKPSCCVELLSAAAIAPIPIRWLWEGWLAEGRLHILAGAPGAGKTTIALNAIAIVSTGGLWPDGTRAPVGNIVIWSGEDDLADTLVPRLIAAGADLRRVSFVQSVREGGAVRWFDPARDMPELAEAIKRTGDVRLVIIDPLALVATKDSHKNAETRRDLQPIADVCRETGAAALGVHHLAKGTAGREPHERVLGSVAFVAVARLVWIAAKEPAREDGAPERRILMRAKSNIGPEEGGFAYALEQIDLGRHPGVFASRVVWGETIEGSAREVLVKVKHPDGQTPIDGAKDFLREMLAEGPVASTQVQAAAHARGLSWATVRRAKRALGIKAHKMGLGEGWTWQIPNMLTHEEDAHPSGVSIFGGDGHLRHDSSGTDNIEAEF